MSEIRYKHSKNFGDLIAILPGIKHLWKTTGKKAVIVQKVGLMAYYYENAVHPIKNEDGNNVCMTEGFWAKITPLLEAQEYIERCEIFNGQTFDIDLDTHMVDKQVPMPAGDIHYYQWFLNPELATDLSEPWLDVGNVVKADCIYINMTERYRNPFITYFFLKPYERQLIFGGTEQEHSLFCKQNNLNIELSKSDNFLDVARMIKSCKFFIGCQSANWHLADAMKTPRILEMCNVFPNTFPTGKNGYVFLKQEHLEYYFNKLIND